MDRVARLQQLIPDREAATQAGKAGLTAGVVGSTAMAAFLIVVAAWRGFGAVAPFRAMSALFVGKGPIPNSAWALLVGFAIHAGMSVVLGILYAVLVKPTTAPLLSVVGGLLLGVAVCVLMTSLVLPVVDRTLLALVLRMPTAWLGAHVTYGLCLGWAPQLRRAAARPRRR